MRRYSRSSISSIIVNLRWSTMSVHRLHKINSNGRKNHSLDFRGHYQPTIPFLIRLWNASVDLIRNVPNNFFQSSSAIHSSFEGKSIGGWSDGSFSFIWKNWILQNQYLVFKPKIVLYDSRRENEKLEINSEKNNLY